MEKSAFFQSNVFSRSEHISFHRTDKFKWSGSDPMEFVTRLCMLLKIVGSCESRLNQPALQRNRDCFRAALHIQFIENVTQVRFDCVL